MERHNLVEKADNLHEVQTFIEKHNLGEEYQEMLATATNLLDEEHVEHEKGSANNCRKIKNCNDPFCPEMNDWRKRKQVYQWLERYQQGRNVNVNSLAKACSRHELPHPAEMTIEEVQSGIFICTTQLEELRPMAPKMREKLLKERLSYHKEQGDDFSQKKVEAVMKREATERKYCRLKCATRPPRAQAMSRYTAPDSEGNNTLTDGREGIESDCPPRLKKRFKEGCDAPINTGQYLEDFGTLADTDESDNLLQGNYLFPVDGDPATELILKEVALLWEKKQWPI